MAHTTQVCGVTFIHNGDFSGDAEILDGVGCGLRVPVAALVGFVAEIVRTERIGEAEQATASQLLNIEERHSHHEQD